MQPLSQSWCRAWCVVSETAMVITKKYHVISSLEWGRGYTATVTVQCTVSTPACHGAVHGAFTAYCLLSSLSHGDHDDKRPSLSDIISVTATVITNISIELQSRMWCYARCLVSHQSSSVCDNISCCAALSHRHNARCSARCCVLHPILSDLGISPAMQPWAMAPCHLKAQHPVIFYHFISVAGTHLTSTVTMIVTVTITVTTTVTVHSDHDRDLPGFPSRQRPIRSIFTVAWTNLLLNSQQLVMVTVISRSRSRSRSR